MARKLALATAFWNHCGSQHLSNAPLASLAALARSLRSPLAVQIFEFPGAWRCLWWLRPWPELLPKSQLKIIKKTAPKPSQIDPKPSQNRSKMGSETGSKTESHLGPFFAPFFRGPGCVWGRLGTVLPPKLGLPKRPKTKKNRPQNRSKF